MPFDDSADGGCNLPHNIWQVTQTKICAWEDLPTVCACGSPIQYEYPLQFVFMDKAGGLYRTFHLCRSDEDTRKLAEEHQEKCRCGTGELLRIDYLAHPFGPEDMWWTGWFHDAHKVEVERAHDGLAWAANEVMCVTCYVCPLLPSKKAS
jgi:hypothetical protein